MKKLLVLVCAAVMSISASAQKGEKAIGVNLSYGSKIKNAGIGGKGAVLPCGPIERRSFRRLLL